MKSTTQLLVLILLVITFSCKPTIISYDSSEEPDKNFTEYLNYYLPKSYLKIKVPVEKKELQKKLIHSLDTMIRSQVEVYFKENYGWEPEKEPVKKYNIGEKIQFVPITVPDKTKHYTIAYKKAKTFSQNLSISLNKDGIIASGQFSQESRTYEFVAKGLELTASIISKFFSLGPAIAPDDLSNIGGTSPEFKRIVVLEKELQTLLNAKSTMITTQISAVPKDYVEFKINLIDKRILEIRRQIMGIIATKTYWVSFLYEPKPAKNEITLMSLDNSKGIAIPNSGSYDLSYINDSMASDNAKKLTIKSRKLSPALDNNSIISLHENKAFLRYNIPAKYTVQLLWDGKPLKSYLNDENKTGHDLYTMYFPQRGSVGTLSGNFNEATVIYYEDIGAIKEIKFAKAATLDASAIQTSYAVADSIASLRNTIAKYKENKIVPEEEPASEETEETIIRLIIEDGDLPDGLVE